MLDCYGRKINYLRLSVTELCNLRCRYCMPETGICKKKHEDMLTQEEMLQGVRAATALGIDKVRITGGEPLVKKNILSICNQVAALPGIEETCLTTNGVLLPRMANSLAEAGISRLNISMDTLNREKYAYITRIGSLTHPLAALEAALSAGFSQVKINVVLMGGFNDDEIPALAELTKNYKVDVRFIELMPLYDGGDFGPEAFIPCTLVPDKLPELVRQKDDEGVAALYRFPGAQGNVGLITAVSNNFCRSCNRIRLTADGKIKPCLHSSQEYNIKGLSYEEMLEQFAQAIKAKPANHGPLSYSCPSAAGRNMNQIGG